MWDWFDLLHLLLCSCLDLVRSIYFIWRRLNRKEKADTARKRNETIRE